MMRLLFADCGTLSVGRVYECWKDMKNLCGAFALTTNELSVEHMMGRTHLIIPPTLKKRENSR